MMNIADFDMSSDWLKSTAVLTATAHWHLVTSQLEKSCTMLRVMQLRRGAVNRCNLRRMQLDQLSEAMLTSLSFAIPKLPCKYRTLQCICI